MIPTWIGRYFNLQELLMAHNRLSHYEADALFGLLNLVILDLSHNAFTNDFASIPRSNFLLRIDLSNNYLTGVDNLDRC